MKRRISATFVAIVCAVALTSCSPSPEQQACEAAGARGKTEAASVGIARRMLATSIVVLPFVAVFALGWGLGTGWA